MAPTHKNTTSSYVISRQPQNLLKNALRNASFQLVFSSESNKYKLKKLMIFLKEF